MHLTFFLANQSLQCSLPSSNTKDFWACFPVTIQPGCLDYNSKLKYTLLNFTLFSKFYVLEQLRLGSTVSFPSD